MGVLKGRIKTGGRQRGVLNKATADVRALAQQYGDEAIKTLANIMVNGVAEQARIAAARELLDRGYGKSRQSLDVDANVNNAMTIENLRSSLAAKIAALSGPN